MTTGIPSPHASWISATSAKCTALSHCFCRHLAKPRRRYEFLFGRRFLLVFAAALLFSPVASATQYVYDSLGRVVAALPSNGGNAIQYTYDSDGNVLSVQSIPPGQLAIFTVGPQEAVPGSQITIYGNGFDTTTANDTVTFNGVSATVISATANQLVIQVPAGATSGPVSVTVGNSTASSAQTFVSTAPSITGISPTVIADGGSITITGSGLNPIQGGTSVEAGSAEGGITSISNLQVQATISGSQLSSGPVEVTTPYGSATSSGDLVILPQGITPANVTSTGVLIAAGSPQNISLASASNYAVLSFNATAGQYLTIEINSVSTPHGVPVLYSLYSPWDHALIQSTFTGTGAHSLHLPVITLTGTYMLLLQAEAVPTTLQVALQNDPTVTANGSSVAIPAAQPGQDFRFVYTASPGDNLGLALTNPSDSSGRYGVDSLAITITDPDGQPFTGAIGNYQNNQASCSIVANGCAVGLPFHPLPGTYLLDVSDVQGRAFSATASLSTDLSPTLPVGSPQTVTTTFAGQEEMLQFSASAGQTFALYLAPVTFNQSNTALDADVYGPGGVLLQSFYYEAGVPATFDLPNLAAGTYTVLVWPCSTTSSALYTAALGTIQATLAPGVTNALTANGSSTSFATTVPGQVTHLTFSGTAGESLAIALTNISVSDPSVTVLAGTIYVPDGSVVGTGFECGVNNGATTTCEGSLPNLPQTGTYSLVINQYAPADATMSMTAILTADVTGALTIGTAVNVNLTEMGQNGAFTFSATKGQSLTLHMNNPVINQTTDASQMSATVYDSSGNVITNIEAATTTSVRMLSLKAGTYWVILSPDFPATSSVQIEVATK
jgi:trimeric autotransporter adhesin